MDAIELIAKSSGQVTSVTGNSPLSLSRPGVVKIAAAPEDVQSLSRNGDHLLVRLKTGKVITVENFFQGFDGVHNDLVLQAPDGQLWQASYEEPWDGMELTRLDSVDELLALQSDDHNVAFGLLVPAAGLGAIGVGNMLTQSSGGGGGSPRSFPPPGGEVPAAPQILFNNQQGLTGTAEPGSLITLTRPDGTTETTTASPDGTWSFLPNPLEDGQSGSVTASNGNGTGPAVDTGPADLTPPKEPVVTGNNADGLSGTGEAGDTIILTKPDGSTVTTQVDENGNWSFPENPLGNGESGSLVEVDPAGNHSGSVDTGPADVLAPEPPVVTENNGNGLGGTGEPEGIVTVELPDGSTVTAIVDENGNWEFPENPLENGETGSVTITDPAGNVSPPTITDPADTIAPEPPVVTENGDGLAGTGEPEGIVTVELPDGSTVTTVVDGNGNWEFPENPLESGEEGTVTVTDPAGNISGETPTGPAPTDPTDPGEPVDPPSAPSIDWIRDDQEPLVVDLQAGDSTNDRSPTVGGSGIPGSLLTLYVDDKAVGSVTVGEDGKWEITIADLGKEDGTKRFTAEQSVGGPASPKSEVWEIVLDTQAPGRPLIDSVYDNLGEAQGPIPNGGETDDIWPTISGHIEGDDIAYVKLFDKGVLVGSAAVDASGAWVFEKPLLGVGEHKLQVLAVDKAGNEGPLSASWNYSVPPPPPPPYPVIEDIVDDFGNEPVSLEKGDFTDDRTPTVKGTGTPGHTMELYLRLQDDGSELDIGTAILLGSATVGADGSWEIACPDLFEHGGYGEKFFYASSYDAQGDRGPATGAYDIILESEEESGVRALSVEPTQAPAHAADEGGSLVLQLLTQSAGAEAIQPRGQAAWEQERDIDLAGLLEGTGQPVEGLLASLADAGGDSAGGVASAVDAPAPAVQRIDLLELLHSQQLVL
ncbi:Ig-like domain-containing protein [Pseudomonas citronellolis]|uniref:Ig-like domain-containing protein n=1 Tax=Pseudomonas citronellolis TaxID=53408 RepID=UPI0021619E23|nr:Ig-like domain-containing protein [Pseudomonas citronellolis]